MLPAIPRTLRPTPPSGVTVNFTTSPEPEQVPRRGTCKGLSAGSAGRAPGFGPSRGPRGTGRHWARGPGRPGGPGGPGGRALGSSRETSIGGGAGALEAVALEGGEV